jgi:glycine/D-amino acid oxidase-like deaminating enzyme
MSDFDFDAVVVGAGAVGLASGYALSRRGLVTAVLEAGPIPKWFTAGSTIRPDR